MQNDNTTKPKVSKPKAPKTRSVSQDQYMDIVEDTLRTSINTINNVGHKIRFTAAIVLQIAEMFSRAGDVVIDPPESTRGLKTQKLAQEVMERLRAAAK